MHSARLYRTGTSGEARRRYVHKDASLAERLAHTGWDVTETGCWEWRGYCRPSGHGAIGIGKQAVDYAHRISWIVHNGPIPDGQAVCHRCDNPPCVNPAHLFLGTISDNNADMRGKGRQARGQTNGSAKLTDDQVREIRRMAGSCSQRAIAEEFGVTQQLVSHIIRRTRWGHVT